MDALLIDGPSELKGEVTISGSKNTALPFLFSSLLCDDKIKFSNVPRLWDIETTLKILTFMGAEAHWDKKAGTIEISPKVSHPIAPYELVRKMRAGILALGPLLASQGEARVSLPGGCAIGARPVNFHLDALKKMGTEIDLESGYIDAKAPKGLRGARIDFPDITVTGTENILTVAAVASGVTEIHNAAQEPEVVALGKLLQRFGAKIEGLGTPIIIIEGGTLQAPTEVIPVPPDRIETGTWISIAVGTRSKLTLLGCAPSEIESVLAAYRQIGVRFEVLGSAIRVLPPEKLSPLTLNTEPYPGFPTDMQAQLLTNLCQAEGDSVVVENIFENRFMHVAELRRLGAKIEIEGNTARVQGPVKFVGAPIMATDLRASACLVVAALGASGQSRVSRVYHLDRGYQRLDEKLTSLGARVTRIAE